MAKPKQKRQHTNEPEVLNRKARHSYEVLESLEVGLSLRGTEVKAIRAGLVSLGQGYVRAQPSPLSLTLHGVHIQEYAPGGAVQHAPTRARGLLAHKREIVRLSVASSERGVTIVPLRLYFKEGLIKLEVGLCRGKKQYDKRHSLKAKQAARDIARELSRRR